MCVCHCFYFASVASVCQCGCLPFFSPDGVMYCGLSPLTSVPDDCVPPFLCIVCRFATNSICALGCYDTLYFWTRWLVATVSFCPLGLLAITVLRGMWVFEHFVHVQFAFAQLFGDDCQTAHMPAVSFVVAISYSSHSPSSSLALHYVV